MIRLVIFVMVATIVMIGVIGNSHTPCMAYPNIIRVPEDYPTIKNALAAASSGDTILVSGGPYAEGEIVISQSFITLEANGTVIVDGLHEGNVFTVYGNNVTIRGFSVMNSKLEKYHCGIGLVSVVNCAIERNCVTDCWYGIMLNGSSYSTVYANTVTSTYKGIDMIFSVGDNVTGNNATSNSCGILLHGSNACTIVDNIATNNSIVGIELFFSHGNEVAGNILLNNWYGAWINGSSNNQITQNIVTSNHFGVWLWDSNNDILEYNNLTDNEYSFGVWGEHIQEWIHNIDTSNTVNGKPIYYLVNQSNMVINASTFPEIGFLAVINSTNIIVENLSLTGNMEGLSLACVTNVTLQNLNVYNNCEGILLVRSENTSLISNCVSNNDLGIRLFDSGGNFLRSNNMTENHSNFGVQGEALPHFVQDTDTSNLVNGKPIYYWVNESDKHFPSDAGFVAAVNCTDIAVQDLNLTNNGQGVLFACTTNSTIQNNNIVSNWWSGTRLWSSNSNIIEGNTITSNIWDAIQLQESENNGIRDNVIMNNWCGMRLYHSNNNTIYHNNFINNTNQVRIEDSLTVNIWDDGYPSGGNYWSNCTTVDEKGGIDQDQPGSDGICDTPYNIDTNNIDTNPLKGVFSAFKVSSELQVQIVCNSSISNFQSNGTAIIFNVSSENGTVGFCRILIPTDLLDETYRVFVNGTEISYTLLPCSNETHTYLYFNYNHSTQEVVIIPEFPSLTILILFLNTTLLAVIACKREKPLGKENS